MTKQKQGFLLFLTSLIPGAGEMYMGFRKQGISIMVVFWGIFALTASTWGFNWLIMFLPILWFYSFFNVHNLKSLSEEEFYAVEDDYILHFGELLGDAGRVVVKHRRLASVLLILIGFSMLWDILREILYWLLPNRIAYGISLTIGSLPQLIVAVLLIFAGIYIITNKKRDEENDETQKEEHFWQPYRPYQQEAQAPESQASAAASPEASTVSEAAPTASEGFSQPGGAAQDASSDSTQA